MLLLSAKLMGGGRRPILSKLPGIARGSNNAWHLHARSSHQGPLPSPPVMAGAPVAILDLHTRVSTKRRIPS